MVANADGHPTFPRKTFNIFFHKDTFFINKVSIEDPVDVNSCSS